MQCRSILNAVAVALLLGAGVIAHAAETKRSTVYPVAVFPFQERGNEVADLGGQVADLLFASLATNPDVYLVEREDLKKLLQELEISQAGLTDPKQSTQVGQLTGAKILVAGSVFQVGDKTYLVAKIIGTESSRVVGASVAGKVKDDLGALVGQLAKSVATSIKEQGDQLVAKPLSREDRVAELAKALKDARRPAVSIDVTERHVGQPVSDPAAETELAKILTELGFQVVDRTAGDRTEAEIVLVGEGLSQFAARHGNLVSVKARLEVKALERKTGRVLAVDRQTTIGVDLAELLASKSALQDAAAAIAGRLLPAMLDTKAEAKNRGK